VAKQTEPANTVYKVVEVIAFGQKTRRARCRTHEPHFKRRLMINQAR
jgi:hypothetical protein